MKAQSTASREEQWSWTLDGSGGKANRGVHAGAVDDSGHIPPVHELSYTASREGTVDKTTVHFTLLFNNINYCNSIGGEIDLSNLNKPLSQYYYLTSPSQSSSIALMARLIVVSIIITGYTARWRIMNPTVELEQDRDSNGWKRAHYYCVPP